MIFLGFLKKAIPSILQIIAGFILLPLLCKLLSILDFELTENIVSVCVGLVSGIPFFEYLTDAIVLLVTNAGNTAAQQQFLTTLVNPDYTYMFIAAAAGMWSGICFKLGDLIGLDGLPVMQSISAVVISCLLTKLLTSYGDCLYIWVALIFSLALNVFMSIITTPRRLASPWFYIVWELGCEGVIGVFSCAFVAFLITAMQGLLSWGVLWIITLCLGIPMIVFLFLAYILP